MSDTHWCDELCTGYDGGPSGWRDNEPAEVHQVRWGTGE